MDLGLYGKAAIVNGASQGLGYATAVALAEEGAVVTITGRRQQALDVAADEIAKRTGATVYPVQGDIRTAEDCVRIVAEGIRLMGAIDVLVNNDGAPPLGEFMDFDDDAWRNAVERNLLSVTRLIRAVVPSMRERGGGSIINVTALSVLEPIARFGLSVSTWAGVLALAKTLSLELASSRIRVNTVCPGLFETLRQQTVAADVADSGANLEHSLGSIPLGRLGRPQEFASLIAFLASPRSAYITGTVLHIDGGLRRSLL